MIYQKISVKKLLNLLIPSKKKTINEEIGWLLYFDYITGEIFYCFKGDDNSTDAILDKLHLINHYVVSIHNHTKNLYSFPSPENFDILEKDYEIICSINSFWTIEFKGIIKRKIRNEFLKNYKYTLNLQNSLKEPINDSKNTIG